MNKSPEAPDTSAATDSTGGEHRLKSRTWSVGWTIGIDKARGATAYVGRTFGHAVDHLRQAWGRLLAMPVWASSRWRIAGDFFVASGLAMLFMLIIAAFLAIYIGDRAYRNLQLYYQTQMLRAVAEADVIHDTCRRRSDIFWEECATPAERGEMSNRFVWAMLVSADVIDPLSVALPTKTQLDQLTGSDAGAAVVAAWLRNQDRARLTGVPLLIAVSEFCESSDGDPAKAPALSGIVTASLADIYEPLPGGEDWLKPELIRAMGLSPPASLAAREPAQPGGTWPAPADLRAELGASGTTVLDERRAKAWQALVGTANVAVNEPDPIEAFLGDSVGRRAVPDQIGDADVVATLFALGGLIDRGTNNFRTLFDQCQLSELTKDLGEDQKEALVANLEKLALFIAGQIRISPEVKRARFWVSVYTGHEQRLIFIMATFGLIVVMSRIAMFLVSTVITSFSRRPAALSPFDRRPITAAERDNEFDRLASSRWPIRIAVAILPAIGFIGTVRGIMLSLSGADAIVWAETVNQRSAAISGLSADLGLAFATTLLALLFGALLTILVAIEMALGERLLIQRYAQPGAKRAGDG
ncbi:MAG: MotA/TolQ/ExbB proton channel family protein [Phenylobacterium sp.]